MPSTEQSYQAFERHMRAVELAAEQQWAGMTEGQWFAMVDGIEGQLETTGSVDYVALQDSGICMGDCAAHVPRSS